MRSLHVAVAQVHSKVGDVDGNLDRMRRQVLSAGAVGVEAILFAETSVHAYDLSPDNLALAEPTDGPIGRRLSRLAAENRMAILAGFLERDGDRVYNSHLVAWPDGRLGCQRKHSLTPGEIEKGLTRGPRERTVFDFNGVRAAVVICADTGIEGLSADLARLGVEYRFIPTAGGGKLEEMLHESALSRAEARAAYAKDRTCVFKPEAVLDEKDCPLCGFASANALGYDGRSACHRGHCMIVDNDRVLRAQIPGTNVLEHQQDQMVHAEIRFA